MNTLERLLRIAGIAALSVCLCTVACVPSRQSGPQDVPRYAELASEFQQSREPSKLTEEDRKVMREAADETASALPEPGLAVGEKAPDFRLPNASGKMIRLSDKLREGPVVLVFYRGAWCPYCNLHLRALHESLPLIRGHGAALVAVTPQKPDKSRAQLEDAEYGFEVLSDLDASAMKARPQ